MVAPVQPEILTIGHSNHEPQTFLHLLRAHGVTSVADVRSTRWSRFPQFIEAELAAFLRSNRIYYIPMGDELGARRSESEAYSSGVVDFDKVLMLALFRSGIRRLVAGAKRQRIALMCAERDPLDCHRALLVCRALREEEVSIAHILADGTAEPHSDTENRLLAQMKLEPTMFDPESAREVLLLEAYRNRGREIAFRKEGEGADVSTYAAG